MPDSTPLNRVTRSSHARVLAIAVATLVAAALAAGCGGNPAGPTSTAGGASSTGSTKAARATSSGATTPITAGLPLTFARCMRANGVPDFPDPLPGGTLLFTLPAGVNPDSPAVKAARTRCGKRLLGGGPPGPGATTHPSAQTIGKLVRIARCMRQHGVPQFPEPRTSVPSNPTGIQEITDFDGAILLFPSSIILQAPAYRHALTACGAPPLGLPH